MVNEPSPPSVSVVVIAKNEAVNIGRCLQALSGFEDVVVVDDFSSDGTAEIAESNGARVLPHRFESFAQQRNWALDHAGLRYAWVLMLDADEVLTDAVQSELLKVLADADASMAAFLMCRRTMFLGRRLDYSDGFPVWIMRLVHRDRARFVDCGHGELPVPPVDGTLGHIHEPFLHYPFSKGLGHWITRHDAYATREAELELSEPPQWQWSDLCTADAARRRRALRNLARRMPMRPVIRFCHQYIWKWGILDGRAGLAYSLLMAWYEGLIVLKRWEREAEVTIPGRMRNHCERSEVHQPVLPR